MCLEKVFIPSVADKVKNLCELREQKGYSYQIQVDGSINDQTAIVCKKAGADIFVSGSYIFGGNIEERIHKIMDAGEENVESKRKFRTYFKGTSKTATF